MLKVKMVVGKLMILYSVYKQYRCLPCSKKYENTFNFHDIKEGILLYYYFTMRCKNHFIRTSSKTQLLKAIIISVINSSHFV